MYLAQSGPQIVPPRREQVEELHKVSEKKFSKY